MLKNTQINKAVTKKIAKALGSLNEHVVYVGGAIVSLYLDDPSADDVRPTKDLDFALEIASLSELETFRAALIERGFVQSSEDSVACRFRYEEVLVDVMSTVPIGWAPGNRWFEAGFGKAFDYQLDDLIVCLLPLPYFLGTKFDAFLDRGIKDVYASHDFEDIVYLFNHTSDITEQIADSEKMVKDYLTDCASKIIGDVKLQEAILGNLFYEAQDQRFELIMSRLKAIASEP